MKIVAIETHLHPRALRHRRGRRPPSSGVGWSSLDTLLVRVVTDEGLEGWGEGFGHACCPATRTVVDTQLAPAVLGEDARDIRGLMARLAQRLHLFGRNGPHVYALSALDIALWDIAGKAAGLPLWRLLGGAPVGALPAYASLLRYGAPAEVGKACARALDQGYRAIKLHEIDVPQVAAARDAVGPECFADARHQLPVDASIRRSRWRVGCRPAISRGWRSRSGRRRIMRGLPASAARAACRSPPARMRRACSRSRAMLDASAVDIIQPSVAKIGGITEVMKIAARRGGSTAFGSCRTAPISDLVFWPRCIWRRRWRRQRPFERLFVDLEASPYHDLVEAKGGRVTVPDGPGLGRDPDLDILRRYALSAPTILRT